MKKLLLGFLLLAGLASAQIFPQAASSIRRGAVLPTTCRDSQVFFVNNTGMYQCIAGVWTAVPTSGGGGSGTVTVSGGGNLTNTAIMTGAGTQVSQTPSATTTLDSSGNISTPGGVTMGVGGSVGGFAAFGQGTATAAATGEVGFEAPASVTTPFLMKLPAAPITGLLLNTGTSDPSTISFLALGTGVQTALGQAVSGSGAICLATGSSCGSSIPTGSGWLPLGPEGNADSASVGGGFWDAGVSGQGVTPAGPSSAWKSGLSFSHSGTPTIHAYVRLPWDMDTTKSVDWVISGTDPSVAGGNTVFTLAIGCYTTASSAALPSFGTALGSGNLTFNASWKDTTITGLSMATGSCTAGSLAVLEWKRDNTATSTAAIIVGNIGLRYTRL